MEFESKGVEETAKIAREFVQNLKPEADRATVVGLYGDLGAGKTTFMKYLAESLGIKETIQSPTFVIMKKYEIKDASKKTQVKKIFKIAPCVFQNLVHIDAYRIEKDEEMLNLDWLAIINDPKNLVCVEWPELIAKIMPSHIKIFFEHGSKEGERKLKIVL
jgi:tRNA threonylcarbamoyladenosine biosynthesis protein TsaE